MFLERSSRSERDAERLHAVAPRARVLRLAASEAKEVRELRSVGGVEAHEEGRISRALHLRSVALDRGHRRPGVETDRDGVLRSVDLYPDVVAGLVVPCGLEQTYGAAAQPEHHAGRGNVAPLGVLRKPEGRTGRVDLLDFVAEHPARDVEVVDQLIDELPARRLDIGVGWRQRVAAGHVEAVHGAELAGVNAASRLLESGVEA